MTCSDRPAHHDGPPSTRVEPLAGSAPSAGTSWLAVEHPGPWPVRAVDVALPEQAGEVLRNARALGIRVQLIRRPGRRRTTPPPHTVFTASHRGPRPWLERAVMDDPTALADLDLNALAEGVPPGFGSPAPERILLVCTHGRKNACCARYGRPAATALAAAHPGRVWETTHLGGDRFAGNIACLPEGTYHGRISADTATAVGAASLAGEVSLPHYRGRAGLTAPAQAAEHAARLATDQVQADAVTVEAVDTVGRAGLVRLDVAGRPLAMPVHLVTTDVTDTAGGAAAGTGRASWCAGCALPTPATSATPARPAAERGGVS